MSYQIAKLTDEDISKLKSERTSSVILMTILISILVIVFFLVFVFFYLNYHNTFGYIVGGFIALIPLFLAYIVFNKARERMRMISDEIYKGVKNVSVHPIENQFIDIKERVRNRGRLNQDIQMTYDFYLVVRGEKMKVTEEEYYKYRKGQLIEIHESPVSKKLLSFQALDKFEVGSN